MHKSSPISPLSDFFYSVKDLSPQKRVPHLTVGLYKFRKLETGQRNELGLLLLNHQGDAIEGCIGKYRVTMSQVPICVYLSLSSGTLLTLVYFCCFIFSYRC